MFFFLLFLIQFCFSTAASSETVGAKAYFFDVGQGHCFFFGTNDKKTAILIDAGSSKSPKSDIPSQTEKRNGKYDSIVAAMREHVDQNTSLLIIVTHADADHHNWLTEILRHLRQHIRQENVLCILGGNQNDYPENFMRDFAPQFTASNQIQTNHVDNGIGVQLFNVPTQSRDANEKSVVTRIEYTPPQSGMQQSQQLSQPQVQPVSFLIPGDAPGRVTRQIIEQARQQQTALQSTVLLASHHGAATDDSNNPAWFRAVQPQYIVFSHGDYEEYWHPHRNAVENALNQLRARAGAAAHDVASNLVPEHVLFYGFQTADRTLAANKQLIPQDPHHHTFAQLYSKYRDLGYRMLITNKPVFSTYTQGDIIFDIDDQGNISVDWTKKPGNRAPVQADSSQDDSQVDRLQISMAERILNSYLNKTVLANRVTDLYFRPDLTAHFLGLNIQQRDMPELISADFTGYQQQGGSNEADAAQSPLVSFLQHNSQIKQFTYITDEVDVQAPLSRVWGNRGLVFNTVDGAAV